LILRDTYYRSVLPMALQVRGLEVLHASAVRTPRGVIAFCAASETGKSTIAYGLSRHGAELWADDAVAFDTARQSVAALPLPFYMRLRAPAAAYFGESPATPLHWGDNVGSEPMPLTTLYILRHVAATDRVRRAIRRLSPSDAFTTVLPHAYCFTLRDLTRKRRMLRQYLDLVLRVPIFELCFRPDLEDLPALLDDLTYSINDIQAQLDCSVLCKLQ
jgi:hypothetical protein